MEYKFLNKIENPCDVKKLNIVQSYQLCEEIRNCIIETVSKNGGHLASNLGVVELTVALHRVLNSPKDKIVWDVGHQSYTHKLLTGRKDGFDNLRKYGGMSGFPKTSESDTDVFNTGHSSTSISAALGIFDKIARYAGAGTLVPVTGFSNAVTSQAMDAKSEGYILGVGSKIFTVAGPVILFGLFSGVIYGVIYYFWSVILPLLK